MKPRELQTFEESGRARGYGKFVEKSDDFDIYDFVDDMNKEIQKLKNSGLFYMNGTFQILEKSPTDIHPEGTMGWKLYLYDKQKNISPLAV